jgi:phosphoribosyl-ATP pyrophosphohydrolase/phosphoribosyl-AMP cyclohydrolase
MALKKNDLEKIKFSNGLIPAVIQDYRSKEVLMVAYMNREALQKSLESGETHFWSRSRQKLWKKGETSGHIQKIRAILADCDEDTLLVEVEQVGVACHTGRSSCFFQELNRSGSLAPPSAGEEPPPSGEISPLNRLYQTILERKRQPSAESYTSSLFQGGIDQILKKVGEEAGEVIISGKNGREKEIVHETADLFYHLFVLLGHFNIPLNAIEEELQQRSSRSGLAEKASRNLKKSSPEGETGSEKG